MGDGEEACEADDANGAREGKQLIEAVDRVTRTVPPVGVIPNERHGQLGTGAADVDGRVRYLPRSGPPDGALEREVLTGVVEAFAREHQVEHFE